MAVYTVFDYDTMVRYDSSCLCVHGIIRGWKKFSAGYLGWGGFGDFDFGWFCAFLSLLPCGLHTGKFLIALVGTKKISGGV